MVSPLLLLLLLSLLMMLLPLLSLLGHVPKGIAQLAFLSLVRSPALFACPSLRACPEGFPVAPEGS